MPIIGRVPTDNGVRVVSSSGGVARDAITVTRTRECNEYWQNPGQEPVCKGTLRWHQRSPRLLDISFLQVPHLPQSLLSTVLLVCQDYPCCNGVSVPISFRARQYVIFEVVVHDVWELQSITSSTPPPVVPAFEAPHYAFRFAVPNIPHGLATSVASFQGHPAWSVFPEPVAHITNRYAGFHYVDDDLNNILRIRSQLAVDQPFPKLWLITAMLIMSFSVLWWYLYSDVHRPSNIIRLH